MGELQEAHGFLGTVDETLYTYGYMQNESHLCVSRKFLSSDSKFNKMSSAAKYLE